MNALRRFLRDLLASWWYYAVCLSFVVAVMAGVYKLWPHWFGVIA